MDAVAAPGYVFVVQGLVKVAHEMDDKLGGLGPQPGGHGWVEDLRGVVLDGRDNTALFLAVAFQIDRTIMRRVVLGVDEVEDTGKVAPFGVADRVGPGGDAGQVILVAVAEKGLEIACGLRLDEVGGKVGDGDVTEACLFWDVSLKLHGM